MRAPRSLLSTALMFWAALAFCPQARAAADFVYMGGDVIADAQVVVVYWGKQMDDGVLQPKLDQFYQRLGASHYFEPLAEYAARGKTPGRASFLKSVQILPNDTRTIDTVEMAREIDRQINAGVLPPASANTVYMVHLGTAVRSVMGSNILGVPVGSPAGVGFCGYHFTARIQFPTPLPTIAVFGQKIRIGVIPDQQAAGCTKGADFFQTTTAAASHELIEAIANPDSVLIEMLPIVGANVQCNGFRIPVASLQSSVTPLPVPVAFNGIEPWAWASGLSQFCNPEEISDAFAGSTGHCSSAFSHNTTGKPDGVYQVSGYFLNSLGRCAIAPDVTPAPSPVVRTTNPACVAACAQRFNACADTVNTQRDQARCNLARSNCLRTCTR